MSQTLAPPSPPRARQRRTDAPDRVALGALAALAVVYGGYALTRQWQALTGVDLAIFDQAVRSWAQRGVPYVAIKGEGFNLLGDHFHPILVLLAPFYRVWDDPRVLLIAQAVLVAASGWPVWRMARRRLGVRVGAAVLLAYGLSWPLQQMVDYDFHEVAFAVPLIALVIDAVDRGADRTVLVGCLLLLTVREDMGAVVASVGLVLLLRRRLALGAGLLVGGLAALLAITSLVIPALAQGGAFSYWTYDALGANPTEAAGYVLRHPLATLALLVTPSEKARTLAWLFLPTGLLSLLSPYVLLSVPLLAQRLLSSREALWGTSYHYSGVLAPVLVLAAVDGAARLVALRPGLTFAVRDWSTAAAVLVLVGTVVSTGLFPLGRLLTGAPYASSQRASDMRQALRSIPDGVCVAVDDVIAPQVEQRTHVSLIEQTPGLSTWLVVDRTDPQNGSDGASADAVLARAATQGFATVTEVGPIVVQHRDAPVDAACQRP